MKKVGVSSPSSATEGDRFRVTARIAHPKQAVSVAFQYKETAAYSFESVTRWTSLRTLKVKGHKKIAATVQADAAKEAKFRVVVTYRGSKHPEKSGPSRVDYWHWQGLPGRYYTAGSGTDVLGFTMAGRSWNGWSMYAGASAEARYTLSGSCKEFKATVGLTDQSVDGSPARSPFRRSIRPPPPRPCGPHPRWFLAGQSRWRCLCQRRIASRSWGRTPASR